MATDKTFQNVQLYIDFNKEVTGATKQPDSVLYSNLDPTGLTNMAIEMAKIYTWTRDVFTFTPGGTKKIMINAGVIPDVGSNYTFQEGSTDGAFQVKEDDGAWQTIPVHNVATLDSNGKVKPILLPSYVDDVIEGYFYYTLLTTEPASFDPTKYFKLVDGKYVPGSAGDAWVANTWYTPNVYEDAAHTTAITGESGKIYVDLSTNHSYRCVPGTPEVWVDISNPLDAATIYELLSIPSGNGDFTGATSLSNGVHGLVPAPTTNDVSKFLCGNGSWGMPENTTYSLGTTTYDANSTKQIVTLNPSSGAPSTAVIFAMVGANGTTAGKAGLVPKPGATDNNKFLTGAGTWASPDAVAYILSGTTYGSNDTTQIVSLTPSSGDPSTAIITEYTGATSAVDGKAGLVKKPTTSDIAKYLRGNGTWGTPVAFTRSFSSGTKIGSITINEGTATDIYVPSMTAATSGAAGTRGTVQPPKDSMDKYLRGDNTWVNPIDDIGILTLHCTNGTT